MMPRGPSRRRRGGTEGGRGGVGRYHLRLCGGRVWWGGTAAEAAQIAAPGFRLGGDLNLLWAQTRLSIALVCVAKLSSLG